MPTDDQEWIERWVRLETKLDLVIDDHGDSIKDHEERIRTLERKPVVTTRGLVGAMSAAFVILGGSIAFIDRLTGA